MILLRILLFNRLQFTRTNHISLAPISHRDFYSKFVVDSSPTKEIATLASGNFKRPKANRLSPRFLNPSADSQPKKMPCPNNEKAKKATIEESKLPQISKSSVFRPIRVKEFPEELSPEAALLMKVLQEELHIKVEPNQISANFPHRHLLNSAAEMLGQRHQGIAKWLSGSDLKKVALFGCPSVERKTVFASKRLRSFFSIQEDTICHGCKLKASCNFVNQRVEKVDMVILADVMRLLTILAFDDVPRQISVPGDLKLSVDKLVKEAVNLSR